MREVRAAPYRILFVDHAPIVGGAQLSLAQHIRTLDRARFEPFVACTDAQPDLIARFREAGAQVTVVPMPRLRRVTPLVLPGLAVAAVRLRRLARRIDADVVVTSTSRAAYTASAALAWSGIPLVWWVRDFYFNRCLFRLFSHTAAKAFFVSEAVRAYYGPANEPAHVVIHPGTTMEDDLASLTDDMVEAERTRWGFATDDIVIGFMGRLVADKGPEDVIAAVAAVHARHSRVKLLMVGTGRGQDGDVEAKVRRLAGERGTSFLTVAGFQSREALFYRMFDVFVHSARRPEGFGMATMQAMMAGIPVIATATGGTGELVRDRVSGLLVPPADPTSLAGAIEELLRDAALRERIATTGRREVQRNNRETVVTRRAEGYYEQVIANEPRRDRATRTVTDH